MGWLEQAEQSATYVRNFDWERYGDSPKEAEPHWERLHKELLAAWDGLLSEAAQHWERWSPEARHRFAAVAHTVECSAYGATAAAPLSVRLPALAVFLTPRAVEYRPDFREPASTLRALQSGLTDPFLRKVAEWLRSELAARQAELDAIAHPPLATAPPWKAMERIASGEPVPEELRALSASVSCCYLPFPKPRSKKSFFHPVKTARAQGTLLVARTADGTFGIATEPTPRAASAHVR